MPDGSALQEWFTLPEILPHAGQALPTSISALTAHAEGEGWAKDARRCRMRWGKGGGRSYHYTLFPAEVQARLVLAQAPSPPEGVKVHSGAIWAAFERAPNGARLKASARLSAIDAVEAMDGMTRAAAVAHVAAHSGVAKSSLWNWIALVDGVPRPDRLAALLPRHAGRTVTAPCDPRAWDVLVADYLRPEQRSFEPCYQSMLAVARREGWSPIPSAKTLKRRVEREYTGNSPSNKPSNYGSHAVPIAEFKTILAVEIERHNSRPGRRSAVCGGTLSFRQAYERSLAAGAMPRVATDAQLRMLLLAAEGVRANRINGSVEIFGTRYWHEDLVEHAGQDVVARFDPEDLTQPLAVYTRDNRLITDRAEAIGDVAFFDQSAARDHSRNRKAYLRTVKESLELERRLSLDQLAALQPRLDGPAAAPERRMVRMVAGGRRPIGATER